MPVSTVDLQAVARLAALSDNVAIATRTLAPGTLVRSEAATWPLSHGVLEGHRFAIRPITRGESLLSWGYPFGRAIVDIVPGEYVCNASTLESLRVRPLGFPLPPRPNFEDKIEPFQLDEQGFHPGPPVEGVAVPRTFFGYRRPGTRGVGTRNVVVILGTTSRTGSIAQRIAERLRPLARAFPNIDGVVGLAHTEGGGPEIPNNLPQTLRALAGFMVHANVAAALALDFGVEPLNNAMLRSFMETNGYPLNDVPHRFLTLSGPLEPAVAEAERVAREWLPLADTFRRSEEPLRELKVALQCGGSDAFSGISGNPLVGSVSHEIVRHGGAVNLCETDELVGGEGYVLGNVRDLATAKALLEKIAEFKERLSWHGVTPESNPSGGNKLRGLYNIALKSLGAAHKKDPRTRIERVIDYAEPMLLPGFQFMNSPGNDLEGIAGQVGSGCNLFLFVTGNGSITNFPFVPTLKVTTTTRRHELLRHEMDVNAGRYLDGESMESLTAETFDLVVAVASGRKTQGERAGHSQISLWRNWRQTDRSRLPEIQQRVAALPDGAPLLDAAAARELPERDVDFDLATVRLPAFSVDSSRWAIEKVGLVLPTSLCASQIARMAAERLNASGAGDRHGISRFVALPHTEGCGFGAESQHLRLHRTFRNYAVHPHVAAALMLEHGCEKIPNDLLRRQFEGVGLDLGRFGWASVQLDGGIDRVLGKIEGWFAEKLAASGDAAGVETDLGALSLGLQSAGPVNASTANALAALARAVLAAGGSVLVPQGDAVLASEGFGGLAGPFPRATLAYGQRVERAGLHVVATETRDWTENLAGLGACGANLFVTVVSDHPREGHPLLPVLQFAEDSQRGTIAEDDIDGFLPADEAGSVEVIVRAIVAVARGDHTPAASARGATHFQLTRGLLGVST